MRAGRLRHRIAIQSATETAGNISTAQTRTWTTVETVRGAVRPFTAREHHQANAVRSEVTHEILIRFYDGLTQRHRLVYDSRTFNILSILNTDERNVQMVIMAKEVF